MTDCEHLKFEASVNVIRIQEQSDYDDEALFHGAVFAGRLAVDVTAHCRECEQPVHFIGMETGVNPLQPTTSMDHREARLPAQISL